MRLQRLGQITHQHADHFGFDRRRPLLTANLRTVVLTDPDSATTLRAQGIEVVVAEQLFHPSYALTGPDHAVNILALPTGGAVGEVR